MMLYCQTKFGCKRKNSLDDIVEWSYFDYIALAVTLTLKIVNQYFLLHDSPPHDNTPPYQVWHRPDKIRHTDRMTDGQTE